MHGICRNKSKSITKKEKKKIPKNAATNAEHGPAKRKERVLR
jgi:hypothetical protein